MIISVCGPLSFETAEKFYNENKAAIQSRFAGFFIRQFGNIKDEMITESPFKEAGNDNSPVRYCREISAGGIYGALWEAGEELGLGMKVVNNAIPLRQEVLEILELSDESPYECGSAGSWLIVSDKKIDEVTFAGREIPVTMIGIMTDDSARVLETEDAVRFLTPPRRQKKDIAARKRNNSLKR